MSNQNRAPRVNVLPILMLAYGAASLLHFAHNAVFIEDYPNLPAWLSSARVWAAWIGVTSVGLVGYVLMRLGYHLTGLATAAIYGALGFDGLAHYGLAPFTAHTWTMNLTIWFEVVTAALLLIVLGGRFLSRLGAARTKV